MVLLSNAVSNEPKSVHTMVRKTIFQRPEDRTWHLTTKHILSVLSSNSSGHIPKLPAEKFGPVTFSEFKSIPGFKTN